MKAGKNLYVYEDSVHSNELTFQKYVGINNSSRKSEIHIKDFYTKSAYMKQYSYFETYLHS